MAARRCDFDERAQFGTELGGSAVANDWRRHLRKLEKGTPADKGGSFA